MKDNNEKLNDKELENVMGAGDYIEFIDSDDYEEKETYETAYKYGKKISQTPFPPPIILSE